MKELRNVIARELGRMRQRKSYTAYVVVLPLVAFVFFSLLMHKGMPTDFPIAVLDLDNSPLSRQSIRMVDAAPRVAVKYDIGSETEGRRLMMEGKIEAFLLIPKDMEKKVYRGESVDVVAYVNETNIVKGSLVDKDLRTVYQTFSTGVEIQMLMKQGVPETLAYSEALPIYFDDHVLFNPFLNYAYFLLPCFLPLMLLIFVMLTTVFCIGTELKYGTALEWYETAGGSITTALMGKLLPWTVIFVVLSFVMNLIIYRFMGVPLRGHVWVISAVNLALIFAYESMGILIVSLLANLRLAMSIGGGYSVLAFSYSGLTFPFIAMPGWVAALGNLYPFTFYMMAVIDQSIRGGALNLSLLRLGILGLYILLPLLVLPRLRRVCTEPKYWGRM